MALSSTIVGSVVTGQCREHPVVYLEWHFRFLRNINFALMITVNVSEKMYELLIFSGDTLYLCCNHKLRWLSMKSL